MNRTCLLAFIAWMCSVCFVFAQSERVFQVEHEVLLEKGWNLLTVQQVPENPSPSGFLNIVGVDGGGGSPIEEVWKFDNVAKTWRWWVSPTGANTGASINQVLSRSIDRIEFGVGYWVKVSRTGRYVMKGSVPTKAPPTVLYPGWNLVGIPVAGGTEVMIEPNAFSILSVLGVPELTFDQLVRWQSGAPSPNNRKSGFNLNEEGAANGSDFQFFDPFRPVWLLSSSPDPVSIEPKLETYTRPDLNLAPVDRFPGPEDLVISLGLEPKSAREIRRLVFFETEDVLQLSLANAGGGLLVWEAEWMAEGVASEAVGLSATPVSLDNTETSSTLAGVVASEKANIHVNVDRSDLGPLHSPYHGVLRVWTSADSNPVDFETVIHVAPLGGDWSGQMDVTTVNGNSNAVPNPDLHLSFYEDAGSPGVLRGVIDSSVSTFWPVDVPIFGYLTGNNATEFVLSGSYYLPPGDRNVPPFGVFDPKSTDDIDWNGDGRLDHVNPFPFPVLRTVSITGRLVSDKAPEGTLVAGTFIDMVYGMMREPIQVEGTFELFRTSPTPFAARDGVRDFLEGAPAFESAVFSEIREAIEVRSTRTVTFPPFQTDLDLASVRLTGTIRQGNGTALESAAIRLQLESPDGQAILLHDKSEVDPSGFDEFNYPVLNAVMDSKPEAWKAFLGNVNSTKGSWRLVVDNETGSSVELLNLRLMVAGQPLIDVVGRVLDQGGNPVEGVVISTSGMPFSFVLDDLGERDLRTDSEGRFQFDRIPAMPYNFTGWLPGLTALARLSDSRLTPEFNLPDNSNGVELAATFNSFPLTPPSELGLNGFAEARALDLQFEVSIGAAEVSVGPLFGQAPLLVQLNAPVRGSSNWSKAQVDYFGQVQAWETISTTFEGEHLLQKPGVYLIRFNGSEPFEVVVSQSPTETSGPSVVAPNLPSVVKDSYREGAFVFASRFAGGGSLPLSVEPQSLSHDASSPFAGFFMLQHTYTASADIDLAPYVDFGADLGSDSMRDFPDLPASEFWELDPVNREPGIEQGDPGWYDEDHNYYVLEEAWFFEPTPDFEYDSGIDQSLSTLAQLDKKESIYHDFRRDDPDVQEQPPITNSKALSYQDTTDPRNPITKAVASYRMACQVGGNVVAVGSLAGSVTRAPGPDASVRNLQQQRSLKAGGGAGSANRVYQMNLNIFAYDTP